MIALQKCPGGGRRGGLLCKKFLLMNNTKGRLPKKSLSITVLAPFDALIQSDAFLHCFSLVRTITAHVESEQFPGF